LIFILADPKNSFKGGFFLHFFIFFTYCIQHCFICRPSDSTVPTDAGIEPRTVATGALAVATLVRIPDWGRGISGKALGWEEASFQDLGKIPGWGRGLSGKLMPLNRYTNRQIDSVHCK
jgi:hypothetical protein